MSAVIEFRRLMNLRRGFARGSIDYVWMSRAARKLFWMSRGVPVSEWSE
jgi:hypothetical protein